MTNCYIDRGQLTEFTWYLNSRGVKTRDHSSLHAQGIQAFKDGHWMAIVWNKNWRRYTVDQRLGQFVQDFRSGVTNAS